MSHVAAGPLRRIGSSVAGRVPRVSRDGVKRRALVLADMAGVARVEQRVDSLEVAVAENAQLARALEKQLAELERALVPVIEHAHSRRTRSQQTRSQQTRSQQIQSEQQPSEQNQS